MTHPDGTLTYEDHVAAALKLTEFAHPGEYTGDGTTEVVQAIRGLTHAVLALVEQADMRRREGSGW